MMWSPAKSDDQEHELCRIGLLPKKCHWKKVMVVFNGWNESSQELQGMYFFFLFLEDLNQIIRTVRMMFANTMPIPSAPVTIYLNSWHWASLYNIGKCCTLKCQSTLWNWVLLLPMNPSRVLSLGIAGHRRLEGYKDLQSHSIFGRAIVVFTTFDIFQL